MAKWGSCDFSELKKFQKKLEQMEQDNREFIQSCAKELAARLLAKVIKATPVGDYSKEVEVVAKRDSKNHKKGDVYTQSVNPSGKKGGTLRRGWTVKTEKEAEKNPGTPNTEEIVRYLNQLSVRKIGNVYVLRLVNPVHYASYVEFGHRTRNGGGQGWVEGRRMLTFSEAELRKQAPGVLEKKLETYLKECFGGD